MTSIEGGPRHKGRCRLGVFPRVVVATALTGFVAVGPALSQAPDSTGRGTVTAAVSQRSPMSPGPCFHLHIKGTSDPGYRGTYVATDSKGGKHTYNGEVRLTVEVDTNENHRGTWEREDCSDRGAGPGYEQNIKEASLTSTSPGPQSVACTYEGTYSIRDAKEIVINLNGSCQLNDQGVIYTLNSAERRTGTVERTEGGLPPTKIQWSEEYTAVTFCVSPTCTTPGRPRPPTSGRPAVQRTRPGVPVGPSGGQGPDANVAPLPPGVVAPELAPAPQELAAPAEDQFSERGRRASSDSGGGLPAKPWILLIAVGIVLAGALGANWINGRPLVSWPLPWPSRK